MEEDLLKLELEVFTKEIKDSKTEEKKRLNVVKNYFGVIKKLVKLKAEDSRNMPQIRTKLEEFLKLYQNSKNKLRNVHLYEFSILIRQRKYTTKIGAELPIQVRCCLFFYFLNFVKFCFFLIRKLLAFRVA